MYLKFLSISIAVLIVNDLIFYFGFRPLINNYKPNTIKFIQILYWTFTVYSIILLSYAVYLYAINVPPPRFARVYLSGFTFIVLVSKLMGNVFFIIKFTLQGISKLPTFRKLPQSPSSRRNFLRKTGAIAAALPFFSLNYGMLFGAFNYRVKKNTITLPNLPESFDGLKILQISDIHSGSFISSDPLKSAVKLINDQKADLIFFTGDLVNEIAEEAEPFIEVFKKITAPLGVYSVLGNHDYGDYFYSEDDKKGKIHNRNKMKSIYNQLGWKLLLNEHTSIKINNDEIGLIGTENWGNAHRFPKYGDINKARENMRQHPVNILLTHDPSHWEAEVLLEHKDIDLTLSGHTHGFQMGIEIPGIKWSPSQYLYKQWAGLYQIGHQYIYVNRGLGFIGYPGRLGMAPEITTITLRKQPV